MSRRAFQPSLTSHLCGRERRRKKRKKKKMMMMMKKKKKKKRVQATKKTGRYTFCDAHDRNGEQSPRLRREEERYRRSFFLKCSIEKSLKIHQSRSYPSMQGRHWKLPSL